MRIRHFLLTTALCLGVAGCDEIPPEAYFNRGHAESLLDISSEMVSVSVTSPEHIQELVRWIDQEPPSRAELICDANYTGCVHAKRAFDQFGVHVEHIPGSDNVAVLYYERVLARDCENRYIDNSINPYNLHHPTFGCSIAANTVQMVSDKNQFVMPALLDFMDGERAVKNYEDYLNAESSGDAESVLGGPP